MKSGSSASGALMLLIMSAPAMAADSATTSRAPPSESKSREASIPADDVPAPPMLLLFGIGAVGLIWGRRLAAKARAAQENAKSD